MTTDVEILNELKAIKSELDFIRENMPDKEMSSQLKKEFF